MLEANFNIPASYAHSLFPYYYWYITDMCDNLCETNFGEGCRIISGADFLNNHDSSGLA